MVTYPRLTALVCLALLTAACAGSDNAASVERSVAATVEALAVPTPAEPLPAATPTPAVPAAGDADADLSGPDSCPEPVSDAMITFSDFLSDDGLGGSDLTPLDPNSLEFQANLLRRALDEVRQEEQGLAELAAIDEMIEAIYTPLRSSGDGPSQATRHLLEALEFGGIENMRAVARQFDQRREAIDVLMGERAELEATISALRMDGEDPESALYRILRETPGVPTDGLSLNNPDGWISRLTEAAEIRVQLGLQACHW